jgi:2-polyprenyl-3-methyl-5-hydroxy-6-metoxy-1,4-benzoquinol methylase
MSISRKKIDKYVYDLVSTYKTRKIDLLGRGLGEKEFFYLNLHKSEYSRTVYDVVQTIGTGEDKSILEIGAYLGVVSISLSKLNYNVSATEIPEFLSNKRLQDLYAENDIDFSSINLDNGKIPYDDNQFNAVIMCEVLEHLNFNPLPCIQEVNRILKPGGCFYLAMPNHASLKRRVQLLFGKSTSHPISCFFEQLSDTENKIVGIHWREYTVSETKELLTSLGFEIEKTYYTSANLSTNPFKLFLKRMLYKILPSLQEGQVCIAKKVKYPAIEFKNL